MKEWKNDDDRGSNFVFERKREDEIDTVCGLRPLSTRSPWDLGGLREEKKNRKKD